MRPKLLRGYLTDECVYYESFQPLSAQDTEVPLRNDPNTHDSVLHKIPFAAQVQGVFNNISWKDIITIGYYFSGLLAIWFNLSERTLILEQKLESLQAEVVELKMLQREEFAEDELQLTRLHEQYTELSVLLLRKPK